MTVRAIDQNSDWMFGQGRQSYKLELEALKQNILTRLRSWRGDCFFALTEGIDWNNYLDIGTKRLLDQDIYRVLNTTGGVLRISEYNSSINAERRFALIVRINTIYGSIDIAEEF